MNKCIYWKNSFGGNVKIYKKRYYYKWCADIKKFVFNHTFLEYINWVPDIFPTIKEK